MRSGIAGIDHVVIGVRDLEETRMSWTRLGFTLSPRGRHLGQSAADYCIMFVRDHLELLGRTDRDGPAGRFAGSVARREGGLAVAFAPEGPIEAAAAALSGLGLHPGELQTVARQLELPQDTIVARDEVIELPAAETPGIDAFLCSHLTPELLRRPEWLSHPNGATGLCSLAVVVDDTAALLPAYDRLFGLHEVTTTDAVVGVRAGPHRMLFATADDFETMHPEIAPDADFQVPAIAAIELAVASRDRTADYLAQWQIAFDELPDGRLLVPARETRGLMLFFVPA